jgi:glycosyltransferase involved in cell wall biosynthesis
MPRAICFDVTHMVSRLGLLAPTGIDNVDLQFGRHYAEARLGPAVHYGSELPHVLDASRIGEIVALALDTPWSPGAFDSAARYSRLERAINGEPPIAESPKRQWRMPAPFSIDRLTLWRRQRKLRALCDQEEVPRDAIYLNVAQHMLEHGRYFRWLKDRPDVRPVMFIHDLLPFDLPEQFAATELGYFARRITTAMEYASAFITSSEAVRQRLAEECRRRGRTEAPIHVEPMASMLAGGVQDRAPRVGRRLAETPYFVVLGTIEPRKNHLLLLNIWRTLAAGNAPVPKLVIVGARGWGNAQVLDVLDRGRATRPHVIETSALSAPDLLELLANARALLMPSFDEGYGLPLVEALSIGLPVVACDGPVFREVTQGCATFIDPLDGPSWRAAILDLVSRDTDSYRAAVAVAQRFRPPQWLEYFSRIDQFLQTL